jgi:hypothetical protein
MYFASPIDVDLWNEAKWVATAFLWAPGKIPMMAVAFLNKGPAEAIFSQWRNRYGDSDKLDEFRIAIIEGEIPGKAPGYSVHIGINWDNLLKRYKQAGLVV